jgi:alpha-tubulin suppressor-like RCC1 family protein
MISTRIGRLPRARTRRFAGALSILLLLAVVASSGAYARALGARGGSAIYLATPASETPTPPKITKQPTNKTFAEGENATFESTASGIPAPTVQWEVSTDGGATWNAVEGATSTTLTITSVKAAQNQNQYRAHFKNSAGEVTSKAVILTVRFAPMITKQPVSVTVQEGENASFEAAATGNPAPTVKWEISKNAGATWTAVSGATTDKLTIEAAKTSESGWEYRATFLNIVGKTSSEPATLTVQKAPAVTKQPASTTVAEGNNATFEAEASGFPAPTVQWEVSTDGGGTWTPIPGATANPLLLEAVSHEQDGNEYRAVFTNAAGTATSSAAKLTVLSPPKITLEPQSTIVVVGENATFESAATGFPEPTVQWEVSTNGGATFAAIEAATTDTFTVSNAQAAQNGNEYRAMFTNGGGKTPSNAAILTVATTKYNAVAWGQNLYRQLGNGSNNAEFDVPVQVTGLKFVVSVAAGARHSLALIANGDVDAWGSNVNGQLGNGTNNTASTPAEVPGLTGAKAIAAGEADSFALTGSGTVDAWGNNESGQLGDGTLEERLSPVAVKGLTGVTAIAAGKEYALALLSNGTVKAWGANEDGQLGNGSFKSSSAPVAVKGLTKVIAIAAGEDFSMALLSNGTVMAWGNNFYSQLGNPAVEEHSDVPVEVVGLSGVTSIAAGSTHALALLSGGTVMAWGEDKFGEIGNGTMKSEVEPPVAVTGLEGVTAIAAGSQFSVAVAGGGKVMTWGIDNWGQLGDGKVGATSTVPVEVAGIAKVASISAGFAHVVAFGEPLPAVTEVSPTIGPTAGGTTVTISGANFGGATAVTFGSTAASGFTVNSANSITATSPAEIAGTVDVTVTTPAGLSPKHASDHYTFEGPPTVTKLAPTSGPVAGGTTVVISGTEFSGASAVSFGSTPAAKFTINSNTSITATAPVPSAAGKVNVTVTNVNGPSALTTKDVFKYTPTVASVSPSGGPVAGGTNVTVTGTGFIAGSGLTKFSFGTAKATAVVCASTAECTMTSPAGTAGTVNVIAEANKVKSPVNSPADAFTYS